MEQFPDELKLICDYFHRLRSWEVLKEDLLLDRSDFYVYRVAVQHKKPNNVEKIFTIYYHDPAVHTKEPYIPGLARPQYHQYLVQMVQDNVPINSELGIGYSKRWFVDQDDALSEIKRRLRWLNY